MGSEHPSETGMDRLSLNDDDKKVRDWLANEAKTLGCSVTVDQMGNMFIVRKGKSTKENVAPVMIGSHLDTQPTGGRYDGILGVMAGLEALRTLHDANHETEGPVGLINWTNEEGARFPLVTVASSVWAGLASLEMAWNCTEITAPALDVDGPQNMKQELQRIGYMGEVEASYKAIPIAAHFELHIEQGPILEREDRKIGVVTGSQACHWFEIEVRGRDSHAGTTPMEARMDALLASAKMIAAANAIAKSEQGLITTGRFKALPGSVNTIAHTVQFTLDIRHVRDEVVASMVEQCRRKFEAIAKEDSELGVEVHWTTLADNAAVNFDKGCIQAIESAATESCGNSNAWRHMTSGATHDSCNVSRRCPTAMIFTPTKDGLSHTPVEYCKPEDCILGAQVLLGAVLRYDAARTDLA
ncbi:hypothetical protein Sste5346_010110 [Sporothrix stenoceras]|uniref:Peptidase M20 dimerisation domain-containing protein n=1 Tax=Sporothrix stenoceras TaxID=5173 RepID=A0ABR3YHK3_9PEZI